MKGKDEWSWTRSLIKNSWILIWTVVVTACVLVFIYRTTSIEVEIRVLKERVNTLEAQLETLTTTAKDVAVINGVRIDRLEKIMESESANYGFATEEYLKRYKTGKEK